MGVLGLIYIILGYMAIPHTIVKELKSVHLSVTS